MSYSWDSAPPDDDEGGKWVKNEHGDWELAKPEIYFEPTSTEILEKLIKKIKSLENCLSATGQTKEELEEIYAGSEWYSARYAAGKALGKIESNGVITTWLEELTNEMSATLRGRWDYRTRLVGPDEEIFIITDKGNDIKPNNKLRDKARTDLKFLYNNLPNKYHRERAGAILGYSRFRIWAHEHPVTATLAGSAATTMVFGLIYTAAEYLAK